MEILFPYSESIIPLDNSCIVDFLSTSASTFVDYSFLSAKDVENLRMSLSSIRCSNSDRPAPLLQLMQQQDLEYLYVLMARYGFRRLTSNIFRYSMRPYIQKIILSLSHWGKHLIPATERAFNRTFHLYEGEKCEGRALYSSILVYLAKSIDLTCKNLWAADAACSLYFPHAMASENEKDLEIDRKIAVSLGFEGLCCDPIPALSDKKIATLVGSSLSEIFEIIMEISLQMNLKGHLEHFTNFTVLYDLIKLEAQKLQHMHHLQGEHLVAWDIQRILFLSSLGSIDSKLKKLEAIFSSLLKEHQSKQLPKGPYYRRKDIERKITSQLISGGISAKKADLAINDLIEYMQKNLLGPKDIIVSELNKINNHLSTKALDLLQYFSEDESLVKAPTREKESVLKRVNQLSQSFSEHIGTAGKLLLLIFLFVVPSACGFKTNPKNMVQDFRPKVPGNTPIFYKNSPLPQDPLADKTADEKVSSENDIKASTQVQKNEIE